MWPWSTFLVDEILVRLPVKSLMRFKCVDPSWKDLLTSPSFIRKNMYHNKKERVMVFERGLHGMIISSDNYEESECPPIPDELNLIQVIGGGSYNGVFCIQGRDRHHLYFWNPSTKEVKPVSSPPYSYIDPSYDAHLCCFGGDPNTNVLNLFYLFFISEYDDLKHFLPPSIELYNLTTNSWTILDNHTTLLPVPSQFILPGDGILANGVSHWFAGEDPYDKWILCFDFRNNQFHKLDRPPQNNNNSSFKIGLDFLAEINNSIAYVVHRNLPTWGLDIWILEEEGCCWTKRYIFEPIDGPLHIYTIWKGGAEFLGPSRYKRFYFHRDDKRIYFCRDDEEPVYLASYNSAGQLVHCFRQTIPFFRLLKYVESIAPLSFS